MNLRVGRPPSGKPTTDAWLGPMAPALPRILLLGSPAKADAGTLAGKVAELPRLEVETRQLLGSGQPGKMPGIVQVVGPVIKGVGRHGA